MLVILLTGSKVEFLAEKIFVHRWPHDTPLWGAEVKEQLDSSINKKTEKKHVTVTGKTVKIEEFEFHSLKKLGISVPFFKNECRMIFESQFGGLFAHVHITMKKGEFLEVFNQLMAWKRENYPETS